jgi:hypothetical protein
MIYQRQKHPKPTVVAGNNNRIGPANQMNSNPAVRGNRPEHFQITKSCLNRQARMIEILLTAEDEDLKSKKGK